jgi:hypothetical protein
MIFVKKKIDYGIITPKEWKIIRKTLYKQWKIFLKNHKPNFFKECRIKHQWGEPSNLEELPPFEVNATIQYRNGVLQKVAEKTRYYFFTGKELFMCGKCGRIGIKVSKIHGDEIWILD